MIRRHRITPEEAKEISLKTREERHSHTAETQEEQVSNAEGVTDASLIQQAMEEEGLLTGEVDIPSPVEKDTPDIGEEENASSPEQNEELPKEEATEPKVVDKVRRKLTKKPTAVRSIKYLSCFAYDNMSSIAEENFGLDAVDKTKYSGPEAFVASIKRLTPETISEETKHRLRWLKLNSLPNKIAFFVCLAVFVLCLAMVGKTVISGISSKRLNRKLQSDFFSEAENGVLPYCSTMAANTITPKYGEARLNSVISNIVEKSNGGNVEIQAKLAMLKNNNSDTFGWIKVGGTNISYVVVKGQDNSYYLEHTYTKTYNALGSIFADCNNSENVLDNKNTVLYGHNVNYQRQMFNDVSKYIDRDFFDNNRYITLYTLDGVMTYEIFSIYETLSNYKYFNTEFYNDGDFLFWCNEMKENSVHRVDMPPFTTKDRILTLSTCTNGISTHRYALHARLISIER